ncbi:hypothetical protein D9619_013364 [Psilocybe cf. subviscida]|uniref:Uncharacterized protein n=1 Tax=Psilocybe cf. subviscida TaxID=2480587 RepID=A0A8H5F919_9AGAR|nr:hypothetical protein D9619_013364 [Psilocybe cf. subviscida]
MLLALRYRGDTCCSRFQHHCDWDEVLRVPPWRPRQSRLPPSGPATATTNVLDASNTVKANSWTNKKAVMKGIAPSTRTPTGSPLPSPTKNGLSASATISGAASPRSRSLAQPLPQREPLPQVHPLLDLHRCRLFLQAQLHRNLPQSQSPHPHYAHVSLLHRPLLVTCCPRMESSAIAASVSRWTAAGRASARAGRRQLPLSQGQWDLRRRLRASHSGRRGVLSRRRRWRLLARWRLVEV